MKRLTRVDEDGTVLCIGCVEEKECNGDCLSCQHDIDAIEKLAEYEDLEEQGKLIRLPCKIGDTVWCLEEDGCVGYVFIAMSGEHYIVSADYVHCDDIYEQLEEMEDDTENGFEPSVYVFHKEKVFFTKEAAEQALARMEKENG